MGRPSCPRAWLPGRSRNTGVLLPVVALVLSGCGSVSSSAVPTKPRLHKTPSSGSTAPGGATRASGVSASAVMVIEGWADALRGGRSGLAASYWAHPSVMVNGLDAGGQLTLIHIRTARDAQVADETLPCGATLRHASRNGKYVLADFALSARSGAGAGKSGCRGPASVNFLIRDKHIVRWLRAPISPGPPPGGKSTGNGAATQSV